MHSRLAALAALPCLAAAQDLDFFETRVRPVLAKNCYGCHGPERQFSALRADSREALLKGGKRGPALEPGKAEETLLLKAVRHQGLEMPANGAKLKDSEIGALEEWVRRGAPWPAEAASKPAPSTPAFYAKLASTHWAFRPVRKPSTGRGIDTFIRAALEKRGLAPAKPASRLTLLRRASLVLTGLPPKLEEIDRFQADPSPDAYQKLVDRLLDSPHFGEHWARHWMDLVRYGETHGYEWNYEITGAWRYRDYLIRAFNGDVPYDQLVREHIAGDLLERPRLNAKERINESLIGTAFFRLGEVGHDDCTKFREISTDVVDNQIDTLTKAFQGLTVSCSRCHHHKMDPIPTEDYYGLYGILSSARQVTRTIDAGDVNEGLKTRLRRLKGEIRAELAERWKRDAGRVGGVLRGQAAAQAGTPALHDPLYPWKALACETAYQSRLLPAAWRRLAEEYRFETRERAEFNRSRFQPFADFRKGTPAGWHADGLGLVDGASAAGDFAVAPAGEAAVNGIFGEGLYTHALSNKLNGALRSPYLPKDRKYLSLRVAGGDYAAWRVIIDNCAIGENYKVLDSPAPGWVRLETFSKEKLPIYAELVTKPSNPRIPDRPGVLKNWSEELLDSPRSWFGAIEAVLHDEPAVPREELGHMGRLFEGEDVATWEQLAERYAAIARRAVDAWAAGAATAADARWLDALVRQGVLTNSIDANARLRSLVDEYRDTETQLAAPRVVDAMADIGPGFDVPVMIAGDPKSPGAVAPRHFLEVLTGGAPIAASGSGRRELAEAIADPRNPLTARVMVNRLWHHVFGRGLVATVDNFGVLGDRPSHPELLDYLTSRFVDQGWSIKKLLREMLLSETFRQSGEAASAAAREGDPGNALLHRYSLRRLPAEAIRDSILAASGSLGSKMFGPGVDPYREEPQDYRRLFSGPLDGAGRRSLYTRITRMEGPKFLEIFDYPNPMATRGARDVTNVPAQALALLNDPFVLEQADRWAGRMLASGPKSADGRIELMFRRALGREPDERERQRFRGLAAELASLHQVARERLLDSRAVWKDVAHAVFNLKEFVYIQ